MFVRRRLRKQHRRFGAFLVQADTHTLFEYPLGKPLEATCHVQVIETNKSTKTCWRGAWEKHKKEKNFQDLRRHFRYESLSVIEVISFCVRRRASDAATSDAVRNPAVSGISSFESCCQELSKLQNIQINSIRWSMCDIVSLKSSTRLMKGKYHCGRKCEDRLVFIFTLFRMYEIPLLPSWAVPNLLSSPQYSNTLQQQPAVTASCCSSSCRPSVPTNYYVCLL